MKVDAFCVTLSAKTALVHKLSAHLVVLYMVYRYWTLIKALVEKVVLLEVSHLLMTPSTVSHVCHLVIRVWKLRITVHHV